MSIKHLWRFVAISCVMSVNVVNATNLLQVYQDALDNDPTYKAAQTNFLSTQEGVPQQLAVLLPQLNLAGTAGYTRAHATSVNTSTGTATTGNTRARSRTYAMNVTQKIFDFSQFNALGVAASLAKAAAADFAEASEDLIQRVTRAYFAELQAEDIVHFAKAKERALLRQYQQAQQRYHVGLDTITDVYEAQAGYEAAVASTIANKNAVADANENLHEITGHYYQHLDRVKPGFALKTPGPQNLEGWVEAGRNHNFKVIGNRYLVNAAKQTIKQQFGGHLPTLNFVGTYGDTYTKYRGVESPARSRETAGELDLNVPLFSGGATHADVKRAGYDYETAVANQSKVLRAVETMTRQDYNGIIASISQIYADKRSVTSYDSALKGARAEFEVGTKTLLDVLTQQENLFNAQSTKARDLYAYITGMIKLEQDAGQLTVEDVRTVNQWLETGEQALAVQPKTAAAKSEPVKAEQAKAK